MRKDIFIDSNDNGRKYICIENINGKKWIIDKKNLTIGLEIYEPASFKGKLFKKIIPHCLLFIKVLKFFKVTEKKLVLDGEIEKYIEEYFGKYTTISVFYGTPSIHQKITVQVNRKNEILGYVKISELNMIGELFYKEAEILNSLTLKGVKSIPAAINVSCRDNFFYFAQSTEKKVFSYTVNTILKQHYEFIKMLGIKTSTKINFYESDYNKMLSRLRGNIGLECLNEKKQIILTTIKTIEEYFQGDLRSFGFYHGDFTPWNVFITNNKLFVFDFEYSRETYPLYLDLFHFYTQIKMLIENKKAEEILDDFERERKKFSLFFDNVDLMYSAYLLSIIELYTSRNDGILKREEMKYMSIWLNMLEILISK